ncbi:hypothetical protein NH340_JMT02641 [Sarcoptes scabiei]|nr:hypothetical protein NH340_JMT02641 [Sarcoptes scabiei]
MHHFQSSRKLTKTLNMKFYLLNCFLLSMVGANNHHNDFRFDLMRAQNNNPFYYKYYQHHHHLRPQQQYLEQQILLQQQNRIVNQHGSGMRSAKITEKFYDYDQLGRSNFTLENSDRWRISLEDRGKGLIILNRLIKESFLKPTLHELMNNQRNSRRRSLSDIPTLIGKIFKGLTNLTMAIGRTINSENGNGSLSKLITTRLIGVSESLMDWVERSVDDLPSIPRLDAQECMKRCICEAHNQPKKYGAVGLIIQLFFP